MRKLKLLLTAAALLIGGGISVWADDVFKNVTSTYITNADFEGEYSVYSNPSNDRAIYQPTGWTVSYTTGDPNDITALNSSCLQWSNFSGKAQLATGGNNTYWVRLRWGTGAIIELSQTFTLPAGKYKLTAAYYKNGSGGDGYILVNSTTKNTNVNEDVWKSLTIDFTSDGIATTKIGCKATHTNTYEKFLAFDNFVLEWNLTDALTTLIANATDVYNEDTSNTNLKDAIDAADDVKDNQDVDVLENAYNSLKNVAALAINRKSWKTAKDAAETAIANGDYDNVAGSERATLTAEIAKSEPDTAEGYETATVALTTATSAFIAAKDSYDAYATAKAAAEGVNEADVLAVVIEGNDDATAADALAASIILPKAYANRTAIYSAPTVTDFVVNGTFDSGISPWQRTGTYQNNQTANNQQGAFTGNFYENWNGSAQVNKMYQTISNIPNGTYRLDIAAFVNTLADPNESQYVFANNDKEYLTTGTPTAYEVYTVVTTNQIEVGLEQTTATANWMGIDNVSLRYYGAGDVINDAKNAAHKLAWEEAKAAAEDARDDAAYTNVTGSERVALLAEIAKAEPSTADDYDAAAEALTTAKQAFVNAKTNYDIFAAYNTTLSYADAKKKPTITSESTAATILPALRAYYESHALAEGVENAVNMTSIITNANDPTNNDGWTWTGSKNNPASNESWTDADGTNNHSYFDGGNWSANSWTTTMSQEISMPAGTYLLTAKGRAATNTTLTMAVGEESVDLPHVSSTGNVFDRGWGDASLEFTTDGHGATILVTATSSTVHEWFSIADFRLVRLSLNTSVYAGETEYTALNNAIAAAEAKTLGFEDGEYAPYNNIAALELLAAAKAIDQTAELTNFKTDVEDATTALTGATWTANDGTVDIIYNGNFAEPNGTNPKGWTRSNGAWGQQITGLTAATNDVNEGTTTGWYYNTEGAWEYGKDDVYKMPLAESQAYKLTFKYRSHASNSNNNMKASVLNDSSEGLAEVTFAKNGDATKFVTATAYFTTGAAGNYILSLTQSGNTHLTDVSLVKVASTTKNISEEATAVASENQTYYETASLTRTLSASYWNTFSVPFNMSIPDGWTVKEFDSVDENVINFKDATTIKAGEPYLVKPNIDVVDPSYNNKIVENTAGNIKGAGDYKFAAQIYNKSLATDGTIAYLATDGKIKKLNTASGLKGLRAYFIVPASGAAARINFIDDETTGIKTIDHSPFTIENFYDMQGRKVAQPAKGLYIKNGKKVIVK